MALAAYRHLLRSTRIAFQGLSFFFSFFARFLPSLSSNKHHLPKRPQILPRTNLLHPAPGDSRVLHAARQTARQSFNEHRSLAPSSAEAEHWIEHAKETALVLRTNVVQGERVDETEAGRGVDEGKYRRCFCLLELYLGLTVGG